MSDLIGPAVSILIHGLAYAMVLYLVSVGLSVTMGLMGFVNLAHGAFAMFGGYVFIVLTNTYHFGFPLALVAAVLAIGAVSVLFERILYAPLYQASDLNQVMMTYGLVLMSVAVANYLFGPLPQAMYYPDALRGSITIIGRDFPVYRLFLVAAGGVVIAALWLGLESTNFGAQVRAAVDNRRMAESLGINTRFLFVSTFALGCGLAALGGALGADVLAISPSYPLEHILYFLIVVSIGGLGALRGAFFAALLLGISDTAFKYLLPEFGSFFVYFALFAVLLLRPAGLFALKR